MTVIYCYLERNNYKVLKFHLNNISHFKISDVGAFLEEILISCQSGFNSQVFHHLT